MMGSFGLGKVARYGIEACFSPGVAGTTDFEAALALRGNPQLHGRQFGGPPASARPFVLL
jgi:hypothetical protein